MAKYLDPRADLTFKKVFGEHKHLVISLLNALLPLADDERVESIEYWPTEKVPSRPLKEKDSIVAELLENPEVSEALKIVEIAAYTPDQMRAYDKFWDNISVYKTLDNARRRSEEKLRNAEAKLEEIEGELENKIKQTVEQTAKRMKAKGFSIEDIMDITGHTEPCTT